MEPGLGAAMLKLEVALATWRSRGQRRHSRGPRRRCNCKQRRWAHPKILDIEGVALKIPRCMLAADFGSACVKASGEERRRKKAQVQKWTVKTKPKPGEPKKYGNFCFNTRTGRHWPLPLASLEGAGGPVTRDVPPADAAAAREVAEADAFGCLSQKGFPGHRIQAFCG